MFEHVKGATPDLAKENLEKLKALFPGVVTEGPDGVNINVEALKQECSATPIEGNVEHYEFTWPGKRAAKAEAYRPTTKTLRPCRAESVGKDGTPGGFDSENLYIEGDNLEVLKLLRMNYTGAVKMIYIDPPYNTGKDFVYRDSFSLTEKEIKNKAGSINEDGAIYEKNDSAEARYHTNWCNMMLPRLKLAKDLLCKEGVLFISIDDCELTNLRRICAEVFGEKNILGQIVLKTATDNNGSQIVTEHEYMLCVSNDNSSQEEWNRKSEASLKIKEQYEKFKAKGLSKENIQLALRKWIKENKSELPQVSHYNKVDDKGVYSSSGNSSNPHPGGYMFDIVHPVTKKPCPKPENGWRWPETTFLEYANAGEVVWGEDETTQPHVKKRIETARESLRSLIYEDNRGTTKELAELFEGKKVFDNPKPHNVITRIADFVTSESSIVLDFFSGSATTAHAIMCLNAKDGGARKFVLVQLPELTYEIKDGRKVALKDSKEAFNAGYENICEIGKERIRRAGKKILDELKAKEEKVQGELSLGDGGEAVVAKPDVGFRVLKLSEGSYLETSKKVGEITQESLANFSKIKDDRSGEDLLFQMLLETDIKLSESIDDEIIEGNKVYFVGGTAIAAALEKDMKMTEEFVKALAARKPGTVFFRDDSFGGRDDLKISVEQIFKQMTGDLTKVKVI